MTIDEELADLGKYLKAADSDSAAAVCERAREVISRLVTACKTAQTGCAQWEFDQLVGEFLAHLNDAVHFAEGER